MHLKYRVVPDTSKYNQIDSAIISALLQDAKINCLISVDHVNGIVMIEGAFSDDQIAVIDAIMEAHPKFLESL